MITSARGSNTVTALERERDRLSERFDLFTRNRDAVSGYLAELRSRADEFDVDRPEP